MSKVDAAQALSIYREFCSQTEKVVEYLGVAKKLQNLLSVPIPTLKHVSRHPLALVMLLTYTTRPLYRWRVHSKNT